MEYLECCCTSAEHVIRFNFDNQPNDCPVVYVDVQLNPYHGFWKRVWLALQYICGHKCQYGHWDETILFGEQIEKLRAFCNRHLE